MTYPVISCPLLLLALSCHLMPHPFSSSPEQLVLFVPVPCLSLIKFLSCPIMACPFLSATLPTCPIFSVNSNPTVCCESTFDSGQTSVSGRSFLVYLNLKFCRKNFCVQETYENLKSRLKCAEMPTNGTCAILFDEGE